MHNDRRTSVVLSLCFPRPQLVARSDPAVQCVGMFTTERLLAGICTACLSDCCSI